MQQEIRRLLDDAAAAPVEAEQLPALRLGEYLVMASRPTEVNELGLSTADAIGDVAAFRGRVRPLADHDRGWNRLLALLRDLPVTGRRIHDANVVAAAVTHGIGRIVTLNVRDFASLTGLVDVQTL